MKSLIRRISINLMILLFSVRASVASTQNTTLVQGNTAFALDLYGHLKSTPGNLFFSPYSISTALAMTYAGAKNDTEKQIGKVLHFGTDQKQLHRSFADLQKQLVGAQPLKGVEFTIANSLWTQKGHPFLPDFLRVATGEYHANLNQADFKTEGEAVRGEVNRWVAQNTKDKIQNILPPGSINGSTSLVLANAIYFKGAWTKPYDKSGTSDQPFHLPGGSQKDAPLMHHFDQVGYLENRDFQEVELPYGNGELSMVVLLPRQIDGCDSLERTLTSSMLAESLAQLKKQNVEIFLPRFKLESEFALDQTLAALGMPAAFGSKADFSGIDGSDLLYISGVFHKAWGEVNEEGTEAAAVTGVTMATSSIKKPPPPPPVFRADHPFIFFIRDTRSGSLLFLGRLANPK